MKTQTPRIWEFPDLLLLENVRKYGTVILNPRPTPEQAVHIVGVLSGIPEADVRGRVLQEYVSMLMRPKVGQPKKNLLAIRIHVALEAIRECGFSKNNATGLLLKYPSNHGFNADELPDTERLVELERRGRQLLGSEVRRPNRRHTRAEQASITERLSREE